MHGFKEKRAFIVRLFGRVQGVNFRSFICRKARDAGLQGWVRNSAPCAVECFIQGPAEAVMAVISVCRKGPFLARVERMEKEETEPDETLQDFEIRY